MRQCDKHQRCALVCRSRRRQGERSADCFPNCPRYARRTCNDLSKNERRALSGIAVDPRAARGARSREGTMYTNVLIPTDGSELAGKAVQHGVTLAKRIGAKATALTVLPPFH